MADISQRVIEAAHERGFVLVGFARVRRLDERIAFYRRWLEHGRHADMAYLARDPERRFDPRRLDPGIRSVVSLGYPYHSPAPPTIDWRAELRGRVAAYALGPDYHDVVFKKATRVAEAIGALRPGAATRVYVDTGAVFEREWAKEARLGWFGKNTTTLNRVHGSYFFLAEIFTDAEFDAASSPYREHCGTCTRCLDRCPTGALAEGYVMESRRCISYLTIENRGGIVPELRPAIGNWVFGCDVCQEVCPWNAPMTEQVAPQLLPYLPELLELDDAGFARRFGKSAIKRAKRRGLLRNAAVALGNTGNRAAVPVLVRTLENEPEALVRAHAAWALGQLGGTAARNALERFALREPDEAVRVEIVNAVAEAS